MQVNELDFQDSIMVLGFPEELNKELLALYMENCKEIRSILSAMSMDLPHYQNLEWRFDVQLASRSLQRQTQPIVTMRLHTKDGGTCTLIKLHCIICVCGCVGNSMDEEVKMKGENRKKNWGVEGVWRLAIFDQYAQNKVHCL